MKNIILALPLIFATNYAQAETVTINATQCVSQHKTSAFNFSKGIVENSSKDNDYLYCDIDTQQNKDIESIAISFYLKDIKPYQSANCAIVFYKPNKVSINAMETTAHAEEGSNIITAGPFNIAHTPSRGVLRCNLPGVKENGLAQIHSFSVTYY